MGFFQALGMIILLITTLVMVAAFESFITFFSDPWEYIGRFTSFILTPFDPILEPFGIIMTILFLEIPFTLIGKLDDLFRPDYGPYVPSLADTGTHPVQE